jgi:hypothetical protein
MVSAIQILFIAGITNIIFLLLVLFSCRCILGRWSKLGNNDRYLKFYKYHCYYWYGFIISVLIHTILAFYLFGWPF